MGSRNVAVGIDAPEQGAPLISIDLIVEADDHVRRSSWGDLDAFGRELVELGQYTAALVRPKDGGLYEVIDGARRRRALHRAAELGLVEAPVLRAEVKRMTDAEAHEARLVTALQREDLSPMEQAEAFATARDKHGRTVEQLAASIKRSPAYVYQHLRLLQLEPSIKKLSERLSMRSLLFLAQLPAKVQRDVAPRLDRDRYRDAREYGGAVGDLDAGVGFITATDVENCVSEVTQSLAHAPFDVADARLVAKAGPCTTCSKRTGTQGQLFEEANRNDLCLDLPCWEKKVELTTKAKAKERAAEGLTVLDKPAAAKALSYNGGYVKLDEKPTYDAKKTWGEILGGDTKPTIAFDEDGREVQLVPVDVANQALAKAKRHDPAAVGVSATRAGSSNDSWKRQQRRAKEKKAIDKIAQRKAMVALVAHVEARDSGTDAAHDFRRAYISALIRGSWSDVLKEVCKRRGWEVSGKLSAEEVIARELGDLTSPQLAGVMVEIVATRTADYGDPRKPGFGALCQICNIDLEHYRREAEAEAREKKIERKAKSKGPVKPSKRGPRAAIAPDGDLDEADGDA